MRGQLPRADFMIANLGKKGSTHQYLSAYRIVGRDGEIMYFGFSGMILKNTLQNLSPRVSCYMYSLEANWKIEKLMLMLESPESYWHWTIWKPSQLKICHVKEATTKKKIKSLHEQEASLLLLALEAHTRIYDNIDTEKNQTMQTMLASRKTKGR